MAEGIGRQRMVGAQDGPFDAGEAPVLRPQTLDEYDVGQGALISQLRISIQAAKQRGDVLEHVLFDGPPGLGKTTLAHIIANEMGSVVRKTSGPALERASDLVGILTNLEPGEILFIDEVHRLPRMVEEYLYPAMEDFRIDFIVDRGPYAKTIPLELRPFTLIGATTRAGMLTAPLRDRFGIFHHLEFYTPPQLARIVQRASAILNIPLDVGGAEELASRARGTARIVNRLLRRVRDYAQIMGDGAIDREMAQEALTAMQVDAVGLDELDRRYLRVLIDYYGGGPAGLNAMAATLDEDSDTLEDMVEPYLLKIGFLVRTSRGRMATARTYAHLGVDKPCPRLPGAQEGLPVD